MSYFFVHNGMRNSEVRGYLFPTSRIGDIAEDRDDENDILAFGERASRPEQYAQRRQAIIQLYVDAVREARQSGAQLLHSHFDPDDFDLVLDLYPEALERWLEGMDPPTSEFRRRVRRAEGFFVGLCEAVLKRDPSRGIPLWRALRVCLVTRFIGSTGIDRSLVKGQRRFTAFLKLPDQSAWTKHPSDVLESLVRIVGRQTYDLVPGQKLYRARIHSGDGVFCHKDLTSAPPEKALNNRMSPAGISFFYGSDEAHTCLAEVRPSVVDTVVVGEFKVLKELRMLDLFTEVGVAISIFSELYSFLDEEFDKPFLRHFIREISRPVHPSEEQTEYVPTQVFTEFLKVNPYRYDGFSFRSSLVTEGANVVLFRGPDISLTEGYEDTDEPWLKYNGSTSYRITSVDLQAERIKWPGVEGKTKI